MIDDIIAEQDGERLVAHECLRAENGITEAAHVALPDIMHIDVGRLLHYLQEIRLSLFSQFRLQRRCGIKVIFDRALAMAADDQQFLDTARQRFLDDILDRRLVDNRQHFLWCRLRCGQEARAITSGWDNGLANLFHIHVPPV